MFNDLQKVKSDTTRKIRVKIGQFRTVLNRATVTIHARSKPLQTRRDSGDGPRLHEVLVDCMHQNPQGVMEYREQVVVFRKDDINHIARIITYVDIKKGKQPKLISLLTNDFDMPLETIVAIYRRRWQIESLFYVYLYFMQSRLRSEVHNQYVDDFTSQFDFA